MPRISLWGKSLLEEPDLYFFFNSLFWHIPNANGSASVSFWELIPSLGSFGSDPGFAWSPEVINPFPKTFKSESENATFSFDTHRIL